MIERPGGAGYYRMRVDEPFKGELPAEIVVRDEAASSTPNVVNSAELRLAVGSQLALGARLVNGEWIMGLCQIAIPAELRAGAAAPGSGRCRPGRRTRHFPARRGDEHVPEGQLITDKLVLGCGRTSILGNQFELAGSVAKESRSRVLLCVDTVLTVSQTFFGGCGDRKDYGRKVITLGGQRMKGGSPVVGIHGTVAASVTAVAVRYSRGGVEYRRTGKVIHPPEHVFRLLRLKRAFGFYDAEIPVDATVLGAEARDADGRLVGSATR